MGPLRITTAIWNLAKQGTPYEGEFLVDTGGIDCLAPREALLAAGIAPEGTAVYELANGESVEFEYGFARIAFLGDETVAQIILVMRASNRFWASWRWRIRGSSSTRSPRR